MSQYLTKKVERTLYADLLHLFSRDSGGSLVYLYLTLWELMHIYARLSPHDPSLRHIERRRPWNARYNPVITHFVLTHAMAICERTGTSFENPSLTAYGQTQQPGEALRLSIEAFDLPLRHDVTQLVRLALDKSKILSRGVSSVALESDRTALTTVIAVTAWRRRFVEASVSSRSPIDARRSLRFSPMARSEEALHEIDEIIASASVRRLDGGEELCCCIVYNDKRFGPTMLDRKWPLEGYWKPVLRCLGKLCRYDLSGTRFAASLKGRNRARSLTILQPRWIRDAQQGIGAYERMNVLLQQIYEMREAVQMQYGLQDKDVVIVLTSLEHSHKKELVEAEVGRIFDEWQAMPRGGEIRRAQRIANRLARAKKAFEGNPTSQAPRIKWTRSRRFLDQHEQSAWRLTPRSKCVDACAGERVNIWEVINAGFKSSDGVNS